MRIIFVYDLKRTWTTLNKLLNNSGLWFKAFMPVLLEISEHLFHRKPLNETLYIWNSKKKHKLW